MQKLIQSLATQHAGLMRIWPAMQAEIIAETLGLQAIPAPTFHEQARAHYFMERFQTLGLADVSQDEVGNVLAKTAGIHNDRPAVLVSAHLDTVFPAETDLTARTDPQTGQISGPGIGDNCLGLAALIALAAQIKNPPCDIWWVASVGEEGLGDLRGMRAAIAQLKDRLGVAIILEGMGLGRIYHAGLGVRRLQVTVNGPGGHSWLHAKRPSAIHHLVKLGAALVDEVQLSKQPRTSFNIGLIEGGTSINTRAPQAQFSIDLRSEEADALSDLEKQVRAIMERFSHEKDLTLTTDIIGDRPSATLPQQHPLVRAAQATLRYLNRKSAQLEIGSTDANIPLAAGISSVCIGITTGGNAHTTKEYIDTAAIGVGMQQIALLILAAAANVELWATWE